MKGYTTMKKLFSAFLAVTTLLVLSVAVFAANATISVTDDRTYEVYQIFTGDLDENTLSNVKWGQNGTGSTGSAVDKSTLDALTAVTNSSDAAKLAVIENYVDLESAAFGTVSKDASLSAPTGYYLFKDVTQNLPAGSENSTFVVKLVKSLNVTAKAGTIVPDKTTQDKNDTSNSVSTGDSADYDIGDAVPFTLSGTVSTQYDSYDTYYYCFHDTLSAGLTFNADSLVVKVDGTTITSGYTLVSNPMDDCTFEVKFANLKDVESVHAGSKITVEYTATLNDNAVVGNPGNDNKMKIEYSNNPNKEDDKTYSPEEKVVIFTFKLVVNKIDGDTSAALKGAGFTLYKKVNSSWEKIGDEVKGTDMTTFPWKGLDDGDYKLVETTTPPGYNTMADIEFTITAEHTASGLTKLDGGVMGLGDASTGVITKDIENHKGTVLPETGSTGTALFIAIGSTLVLAAVVFLVTRKKMSVYGD